jgi:hypothetical protein
MTLVSLILRITLLYFVYTTFSYSVVLGPNMCCDHAFFLQ